MLAPLAVALAGLLAGAAADDDPPARVVLQAAADEEAVPWGVVDELVDGDVLRVRVTAGEAGRPGTVMQCSTTCWNRFPVTFDDAGVAVFQYELEQRACDPVTSCVVRVEIGARAAMAFTVFGGPAPPAPRVTLEPAGPVAPGAVVTVAVDGLAPGAPARAAFCADGNCRGEGVERADDAGHVALDVTVGARCRHRGTGADCGIAVVAGSSRVVVPVSFVAEPSPKYDVARVVSGLVLAAALLLVAWWIVATTNWRPPAEAAVPDPDAGGGAPTARRGTG